MYAIKEKEEMKKKSKLCVFDLMATANENVFIKHSF